MVNKGFSKLVALCCCMMLAGCATSRSEIALHSPRVVAPAATTNSEQRVVVIGTITDERTFEEAPSDPSTPSLGFGGADKATADVKSRAIGRKRNGYGKALGDVLLQPGQTVESEIKENLTAAFMQAGYQVKDQADAGPSALVVDVHIKQFWSWFTPGFWAVTLSSNIATDLAFKGAQAPMAVSSHVEDKHAAATESDWIEITDKGLDAYRADVVHRMQGSEGANLAATAVNASLKAVATAPAPAPLPAANPTTATSAPSNDHVVAASITAPVTTPPPSAVAVSTATAAAVSADTPIAQGVATQMGCGVVEANGNSSFVAPCGTYSVLISCDDGQCRPMHTVNVKNDD
jgi:hypothetical protein